MKYSYEIIESQCPDGATKTVSFELIDGKIHNARFDQGGCIGNFIGFYRLLEGRDAQEVIPMLAGIKCPYYGNLASSSCAEQMGLALQKAVKDM